MENQLPYRVQEDCYGFGEEEEIDQYQNLVVACAEGARTPPKAAQLITNVVAQLAHLSKEDIDLHGNDQPYSVDAELVAMVVGSIASSYPPTHAAHQRLFSLLESFTQVDRRHVSNPLLDRNNNLRPAYEGLEDMLDTRPLIPLWENLDRFNFDPNFRFFAEIGQSHWTGIEKRGSEEQQRWRNLSRFLATLTIADIADLGRFSALFMLLPEEQIETTVPGRSGFLAGQALAAAEWIVPEGYGDWVWKACQRCRSSKDGDRPPRGKWNLEYWQVWKSVFRDVSQETEDERVDEVVCEQAARSFDIMTRLENQCVQEQR